MNFAWQRDFAILEMLVGDLSLTLLLFVRCFPSVNPTMVNRSDMAHLRTLNNVKEILKN